MKRIQPDLWETDTETPAPGLTTHAYLLTRGDGNVLFYNTSHRHEIDHMAELGGVAVQYLSHQDELGASLQLIRERFGAQLGGHVREEAAFARFCRADILFDQRETHRGNIEVIPTPGHSPGSVCFLVSSPHGKRYLFTGDTLYLSANGRWKAGFIKGYSDRDRLAKSLELVARLEPDVALSSALGGESGFQETDPPTWRAIVHHALAELSGSTS